MSLAESAAIASASPAIWKRDLNIGQTSGLQNIELARSSQRMSEQPCNPSVVGLHSSKQRWFSEVEREMQAEAFAHP
jgi:hypothetical protein